MRFVDLAIVNAYVTHTTCAAKTCTKPLKRVDFMAMLHTQLTKLGASGFINVDKLSATKTSAKRAKASAHVICQDDKWRGEDSSRKMRHQDWKCEVPGTPKKHIQIRAVTDPCKTKKARRRLDGNEDSGEVDVDDVEDGYMKLQDDEEII